MLNQEPWPLQPDKCPCDVDFVHWLTNTQTERPRRVFHMGPGEHHLVGRHLSAAGEYCTALTASPGELAAFEAIPRQERQNYECYLADVYDFDPSALGTRYDVASLFHLGEMLDDHDPASLWGTLTLLFLDLIDFGGALAFYPGSSAFDRLEPMIRVLEEGAPLLYGAEDFGSIRIYRKGRR